MIRRRLLLVGEKLPPAFENGRLGLYRLAAAFQRLFSYELFEKIPFNIPGERAGAPFFKKEKGERDE